VNGVKLSSLILCAVPLHATVHLSVCLLPGEVFSQTAGECQACSVVVYFDFHESCHLDTEFRRHMTS